MGYLLRVVAFTLLVLVGACADSTEHTAGGGAVDGGNSGSSGGSGTGGSGGTGGGGSGGSGGTGGTDTVTLEQFNAYLAESFCRFLVECPTTPIRPVSQVLRTIDRCVEYYGDSLFVASDISSLDASIAAGRTRFDASLAARCLRMTLPSRCEWLPGPGPEDESECSRVLVGTVALGDDCYAHHECGIGAYCAPDNAACPGVCAAKKPIGAPCDDNQECLVTAGFAGCDNGVCAMHAIRRDAAAGDDCGELPNGDFVQCQASLACDARITGSGTCRVPIAVGQACVPDAPCEGLALCHEQSGACQDIELVTTIGQACNTDTNRTIVCDPLAGLICVNGTCAAQAPGVLNGPCTRDDLSGFGCSPGLYCDVTADRCLPVKPAGEACAFDRECEGECDELSGRCTEEPCAL